MLESVDILVPKQTVKTKNTPELTIIVPTYNEAANIPLLINKLYSVLQPFDFEILFVDDNSPDGSSEVCMHFSERNSEIRVLTRDSRRGLATAVIEGMKVTSSKIVAVIDADLQHPTELIPVLYEHILEGNDIAIGSRYCPSGSIKGWSMSRILISRVAIILAHAFLPKTKSIQDPISGCFMVKKQILENVSLQGVGYKILLEILTKTNYDNVVEVPYVFRERAWGASKFKIFEIFKYIDLIFKLKFIPKPER